MPSSQDPSCCCLPRCYFLLLFTSLLLPVVVYLAVTSCCCLPRCYFLLLFTLLSVPLLEPLHNINARTFLVSCKISSLWSEACVMGVPVETLPCILIYTPPFTPLLFFLLPPLLPSPPLLPPSSSLSSPPPPSLPLLPPPLPDVLSVSSVSLRATTSWKNSPTAGTTTTRELHTSARNAVTTSLDPPWWVDVHSQATGLGMRP